MMKIKYMMIFVLLAGFTSCSDWLDVKPVEQIEAENMFEDERGFLQTLTGSYLLLSEPAAYGRELTIGFPDEIVRYWDKKSEFYNFKYTDVEVTQKLDASWAKMYEAIANLNLMLQNLSASDSTHFKYYNLIKGEALGLRAYIHLDLLRLFGPVIQNDFSQKAIPYREEFSNTLVQRMTAGEVLAKVEKDLKAAYHLLQEDPIKEYGRTNSKAPKVKDLAFSNRGLRMNYYAVCATLARLYSLKNDMENALKYAQEVIDANEIFQLLKREDIVTDKRNLMFDREVIWTLYDQNSKDNLCNYLNTGSYLFNEQNWEYVYVNTSSYGSLEDYRQTHWHRVINATIVMHVLNKYERLLNTQKEDISPWILGVPMIRLTEMYYIAAECHLDSNPAESWRLLNEVRQSRNLSVLPEALKSSKEGLMDQIVYESRKDFWGEGKLFYLYKRLFRGIELRTEVIPASRAIFELPLPKDELEYGDNK